MIAGLYLVLGLGALTMIYPFALMVSRSFTSAADYEDMQLVPRYWREDAALFRKFFFDKTRTEFLGFEYGAAWYDARDIRLDAEPLRSLVNTPPETLDRIMADWKRFSSRIDPLHRFAHYAHTGASNYSVLDVKPAYRKWLEQKFTDIAALNRAYVDNAAAFSEVDLPYEDPLRQRWLLPLDAKYQDWQQFKAQLPAQRTWIVSAEIAFQRFLHEKVPAVEDLEKLLGRRVNNHADLTLARAMAEPEFSQQTLREFIQRKCPVIFLKLDVNACAEPYREFIRTKYRSFPPQVLEVRLQTPLPALCPMNESYPGQANDWIEFMEQADLAAIGLHDPQFQYQEFLRLNFADVAAMNAAYGWSYHDFRDVRLPHPWIDLDAFRSERSTLFKAYLLGNYRVVFEVISVHGRSLLNTTIFVMLSILGALTINPMAAYALSRYRLSYSGSILLFLLATMAFPASVGMIPSFLLLKDLGLLNTFAALVLPGLANGFSIFLLKGFFDSLPRELYEAAAIDGASEMTLFFRMAMPLTKPILAVIALGAFTSSYSAFMFAFLTCQDPSMWTLMVFLYQFQQNHPNYMVMASLVIAAVPTLIVFAFCQNIILRGIAVPSFK